MLSSLCVLNVLYLVNVLLLIKFAIIIFRCTWTVTYKSKIRICNIRILSSDAVFCLLSGRTFHTLVFRGNYKGYRIFVFVSSNFSWVIETFHCDEYLFVTFVDVKRLRVFCRGEFEYNYRGVMIVAARDFGSIIDSMEDGVHLLWVVTSHQTLIVVVFVLVGWYYFGIICTVFFTTGIIVILFWI